jgi:hypothetical protein
VTACCLVGIGQGFINTPICPKKTHSLGSLHLDISYKGERILVGISHDVSPFYRGWADGVPQRWSISETLNAG